MEIIRLGGLYDEGEKKHTRGELFCVEGLSPTINTCGGVRHATYFRTRGNR